MMDLQQYDRIKLELAEILRSTTTRSTSDHGEQALRDLFGRLAEDRFNLVVVGRFSRGKTSLMNAMLGVKWLPTGVVPVTSVITTVTYGTVEQVVLHHHHTSLFREIPITQLADHITERGNPGNRRRIRTAEVQLPAELLRRGFHFIDTPGLGSSIVENTRTTESFLPQADAFILVTSFDSPLSEEEQRTLQTIHAFGRRVFIVVNKQDAADRTQRQEVIEHLERQLPAIFGDDLPQVFLLSARQALLARLRSNPAGLQESGLPQFEAALVDFLVNNMRREFLLNMCARIGAILNGQCDGRSDLRRLDELRTQVTASMVSDQTAPAPPKMAISSTLPNCEVCARVVNTTFDFMARYQYQLHANRQTQLDLAERHGFCAAHSSLLETVAAPGEICSGLALVVQHQAHHLREIANAGLAESAAGEVLSGILPSGRMCPACNLARQTAREAIGTIVNHLDRDPANSLARLSALCLPHLRPLVSSLRSPELVHKVLCRQADLMDRLAEDMRRFVLKRDAVRRHLTSKEETSAAERAVRILVGHPRALASQEQSPGISQAG
jgi:small GTP-binding protein